MGNIRSNHSFDLEQEDIEVWLMPYASCEGNACTTAVQSISNQTCVEVKLELFPFQGC